MTIFLGKKNLFKNIKFRPILTRVTSTLHQDIYALMILFAGFFLEREMFQAIIVEKTKYAFYIQKLFSWISCNLWDNVEKHIMARQATRRQQNTANALHMQDIYG